MKVIKAKRNRFSNLKILIFLLLSILGGTVFPQQPDLAFKTLDALERITNSKVSAIIQDSAGFLWIGTQGGLYRFDGHTEYPYFLNENDSTSIPSNKINKLFVDRKNMLWICTSGGICRYNPEYNNFTTVLSDASLKGVPGSDIYVINESKTGELCIAFEKSIYKFNSSQKLFVKILELSQGKINAISFDDLNNIWIAASSDGGLFYFDQQNKKLITFRNDKKDKQTISSNEIVDIAMIRDNLWIATYGSGIDSYNLKTKAFKNYRTSNYFENYALNIFIDHEDNLWICTLGSLKLLDRKTDNFFNYYHNASNPQSLGKSLTGFYEDREGNYWTTHSLGGIKYTEATNKFNHFSTNREGYWYTSEKNITSISTDASENLWIGNFYNGIDVFNWSQHRIDRYISNEKDPKALGNGTIFSIFRDSKNQMWIGSNLGGLQKFNPVAKNFETFRNNPIDSLSIAGNDVRSISEDENGYLWIAVQGKGVDRFDPGTKIFRHFNAKKNRLSNDYTFQTLNDSKGNLWVASAYGLNLLPKGEVFFKDFLHSKIDTTTVSSNFIQAIYEDQQHNLWIGTPDGLDEYNSETQTFTRYSYLLVNKNVCSILSDTKDNIWIGTTSGISKLDKKAKRVTNFDQNDGLLSREFFPMSCYTSDRKELFFGGSEGVDLFKPENLDITQNPPTVKLSDLKIFSRSINYKTDPKIINKFIGYADKIVLDYNSNSITLSFNALKLTKADKITYAIKLDGFDQHWSYIGTKSEANFNNLNPGKYTFRVKARYDNGEWNPNETSIQIEIVPPWWMTIWFRIIAATILLSIPFIFVGWRTSRLTNLSKKLEATVAERTREIQQKNDQLKSLNSTKDKLFSIISHDLRSPFNGILGFLDILTNEYNDHSDAERLEMIHQVNSSSRQVYSLIENLLNWARVQSSTIHYRPESFHLKTVILEKTNLYLDLAAAKKIPMIYQIPDELVAFADINLMETSLRNLINNAIKFTMAGGSILVNASQYMNQIKVSVTDSGIGMTVRQIESLFKLETSQTKQGTNGEIGSGLGLVLCKEFVEKNKGSIAVESHPGKGSTFSFTIPLFPVD